MRPQDILIVVLKIFDRCSRDILSVSWRYLISVLETFCGCPGDI